MATLEAALKAASTDGDEAAVPTGGPRIDFSR